MTTETPNYLTAEQERVINDFQRVAREIMGEDITAISVQISHYSTASFAYGSSKCFMGRSVIMSSSIRYAIHNLRTEVKPPAEQAQIDYDRAMKAVEEAKAKLEALS